MVSWFGTLGSSLGRSLGQVGGSMASLTGHNSNVTKAVLRKGDEQGPEDVPESKTKEVEDVQSTFKSGNERKESDTLRDKEKHDGYTCCQRSRPGQTSRCTYKLCTRFESSVRIC
uniref:Uncharacterized protein n=1 Tax=Sus scrofa TaxID=9823 RepID=A0A4X1U271_PIG